MHRKLKFLIIALGAALLISGQAVAGCAGKASCTADKRGCCMAGKANCAADKKGCDMAGKAAAQTGKRECNDRSGQRAWHDKKRHAGYPGKNSHYVQKILRRGEAIGLSDKQRRQIEEILVAARKETAESRARAEALAVELYGKLRSGKVGDADVDAYAARMGELHAARLKANLSASLKASALLSAEQKQKLYAGRPARADKK